MPPSWTWRMLYKINNILNSFFKEFLQRFPFHSRSVQLDGVHIPSQAMTHTHIAEIPWLTRSSNLSCSLRPIQPGCCLISETCLMFRWKGNFISGDHLWTASSSSEDLRHRGATIVETRSWVLSDDRMYEHCLGMIDVYCNAYNMGNHIGMVNDNVKL